MTVAEYIENTNDNLKPIVKELRNIILNVSVDMKESIKWNAPTYSLNHNICSIMVHKHHVNLQLFKAGLLDDTSAFEGTGKEMRHIKYKTHADIDTMEVQKILKKLIDMNK